VGDLPNVAVEVGEIGGIATVEGLLGRFGHRRPGRLRCGDERVDLLARADVVGEGDAGEAVLASVLDATVGSQPLASPENDPEAAGLEEDGFLDFVALPAERRVEITSSGKAVHAEGDEADPLLHPGSA